MATANEIIAALSHGIEKLEQSMASAALNHTEDLDQAVNVLDGTADHAEAAQVYQSLQESLRHAQGAEQQLREIFSNARNRFHG